MRTRFPDPADTWTDDEARAALGNWRRSGKSIAAFARERGVAAPRLYWWKKRLATTPAPATKLALVPATIVSTETTVTIRLPSDVTIEVASASPSWLAAIVAELARLLP